MSIAGLKGSEIVEGPVGKAEFQVMMREDRNTRVENRILLPASGIPSG